MASMRQTKSRDSLTVACIPQSKDPMTSARTFPRLIALLLAITLMAGACASDAETTNATDSADASDTASSDTVAAEESAEPDAEPEVEADETDEVAEVSDGYALGCEEAGAFGTTLRGASGSLQQINDENAADLAIDYDGVTAAIDGLRLIEDVEGPLGTMSEGLDAMEIDLAAAQAGQYADIAGGYSLAKMNAVIVEAICDN